MNGWLILDKPSGITSAHAVHKVKRLLKPLKIGHAGTLDPLASGILPLALGEATKTVAYMMDGDKAYSFTVKWGEETDTDDSQGQVTATSGKIPSHTEIIAILPEFTGAIQQMPPDYSAIKVGGRRAYDAARSGQALVLKAREVMVNSLELIGNNTFICRCGKGTYIRSLARDMGRRLGCFGHITQLRRLKVARFDESCAISLEMLEEMMHKGDLSFLRPVESALDDILAWDVSSDQATRLRRGQAIPLPPVYAEEPEGTKVLMRGEGGVVAICETSHGSMKPVRVFNI